MAISSDSSKSRPPTGPRERLLSRGASTLSDDELVAIILGTGVAGEPVAVLAARILAAFGGLEALASIDVAELASMRGLGEAKATRLIAALELGKRLRGPSLESRPVIRSSRDVNMLLRGRLARAEVEHFIALALDARNRVVREWTIGVGSTSACPVRVADAYRPLVRAGFPHAVFVHNHPSGDPSPSTDDEELTARLAAAGELLGVRLLDHVVIAQAGHFSFADAGRVGVRAR